ncbi:MAG: diguanylate cyclase [Burkholderiaceae bacterium]|nr:diguanylate cyclase [Burkholderiaceae bacterium]
MALLSVAAFWALRNSIIDENVAKVRALSKVARHTAHFFHQRAVKGEFSDATARELTLNVLRGLNYGEIENFFVYDFAGNNVMLPQKPEREGRNWLDLRDEDGAYPIRRLIDSARRNGEPVYYKLYPRNDSSEQKIKMVVAMPFEPWGWAIGTGIFVHDIEKQFWKAALRMGGIIASIALLFSLIAWSLVRHVAGLFQQQTNLLQEYYSSSQTDPLTGCNNRRSLMEMGARDFALAKRHGSKLSVLMLDIDLFKDINDTFGHLFGDQVICAMVNEILGSIRGTDILGRIGGEEFVLVLPDADLEQGRTVAENLRAQIAGLMLMHDELEIHFTVSFGVTSVSEDDRGFDDLLSRADKGLYQAKKQGRNCVCVAA